MILLYLDRDNYRARIGERVASLTPVEMAVLCGLATSAPRPVPHRVLIKRVWKPSHGYSQNNLSTYVCYLRKKLGKETIGDKPEVGYFLNATVIDWNSERSNGMGHITVPEAEEFIDRELPVLDKGFVRLVDYYGGDLRIIQAARISYAKEAKDDDAEGNRRLIDYLVRHRHTSPLEQVVLTFHLKLPIFVARQLVRHRTARLNEVSGRYTELPDECFVPDADAIRGQDAKNKQGRSGSVLGNALSMQDAIDAAEQAAFGAYHELHAGGVAKELARIVTPVATYTQMYWQCDLHNLFHFLSLRLDPHAQAEIRVYAAQMAVCAKAVAPLAYAAWEEHVLHAVTFSRSECAALQAMFEGRDLHLTGSKGQEFAAKMAKVAKAKKEASQ